jgi:hypothetical protein
MQKPRITVRFIGAFYPNGHGRLFAFFGKLRGYPNIAGMRSANKSTASGNTTKIDIIQKASYLRLNLEENPKLCVIRFISPTLRSKLICSESIRCQGDALDPNCHLTGMPVGCADPCCADRH